MNHGDRARSARPSEPGYEPAVDYGPTSYAFTGYLKAVDSGYDSVENHTPYAQDASGRYYSQSHGYYALKGCIQCREAERFRENPLCQTCDHTLSRHAPVLVRVPSDNKIFWDISNQFDEQWSHPKKRPTVHAVYKIIGTQQSWDRYHSYRDKLEHHGQFAAQGKCPGNERLLWHGTGRACNIGDSGNAIPCKTLGCALCSIIRGSFDVTKAAMGWTKFGAGIYTSPRPSKADGYSSNLHISNYKALLLNTVAVGKAYEAFHNQPTLVRPPKGYSSVYEKHDEVVVYTDNAIRPSWLVLYA